VFFIAVELKEPLTEHTYFLLLKSGSSLVHYVGTAGFARLTPNERLSFTVFDQSGGHSEQTRPLRWMTGAETER